MRIVTAVAALLTAATLAACSSPSSGDPTSAPSSPGTATATGPTSFPSSSQQSPASGGLTQAQAQAALLTAAEVGGGFTATPSDNSDSPLPCTPSDPSLSQQFPPDAKAEADFGGAAGKAVLSEEIETFADAGAAADVVAAGEHGLSCGSATVNGAKFDIAGPTDLTDQLDTPVDKAEGWTITSSAVDGSLIIAQLGQHLVVFSFAADPSTPATSLPDAEKIVNDGLAKVVAALK